MLAKVIIENGVKKIQALTADTGTGAPVGSYLYLERKSNPQGYLYCDGSTFDETAYPALYQYLGTNVLPDWREFSAVGAEQNTTNVYDAQTNPNGVIHDHDVYTEGESKDDQLQNHNHVIWNSNNGGSEHNYTLDISAKGFNNGSLVSDVSNARAGSVTRGKRKAVFVYIKATSGLTENQQENVLNTINENNSYSTEEHPTGKKWIDGKPIYEIVITGLTFGDTINTWTNCGYTFSNCDTFIKGTARRTTDNATLSEICFCVTNNVLKYHTGIGFSNCNQVIAEYTKTTD